jgi:threonine/homoserine/homoserine lactone efflux protein
MAGQGLLPGPAEAAVFATAVLLLNATPGVDVLLTVSRTLQGGARAGVAAVAGINAGCVVHALAAAFGLAALLALHPGLFSAVQWAGAGYLAWLGVCMLRQAWRSMDAAAPSLAAAPPLRAWLADFRAGLFTNVLNPKVALFFLAFLPQFVPVDSGSKTASFLLLGAWFVLQSCVFSLALVAATARLGRLGPRPALQRGLQTLGGLLFLALALRLLRDHPALP